jgi:tetratricopeptide (TPR) repeat protein
VVKFAPNIKQLGKSEYARLSLSHALAQTRSFDEALEELETVLSFNPKSLYAHLSIGNIYLLQKRYSEALSHFLTLIKLEPLIPQAPLQIGRIYLKKKISIMLENFLKQL